MGMLRWMRSVSPRDKIPSVELREIMGIELITEVEVAGKGVTER